ncbi:MAG: hypothetical protein WBL80_06425 [Erysipelotrichaceae bacterium]
MKRLIMIVTFIVLLIFAIYLVDHAYVNLDHLGKGKLNSVSIQCNNIYECASITKITTISDKATLDKLESIFFMKTTSSIGAVTQEKGFYDFVFNYQVATIKFNVVLDFKNQTGKIKYGAKARDYTLTTSDIAYLTNLLK